MQKNKLLKYCFGYYSLAVIISFINLTGPTINNLKDIEIAKKDTSAIKEDQKPFFVIK